MDRRNFLLAAAAATSSGFAGRNAINRARVSVITDEVATSPEDAIAFARKYGLRWVEVRRVPGAKPTYDMLPEAELRAASRQFREAGLGVSFLNTGLLKFTMPGTEAARRRPESPETAARRLASEQQKLDARMEDLRKAIRAAHILGTDKVRVFTFTRVAEPEKVLPRVTDIVGEMAQLAAREKVRLLIENEGSCNIATSLESAGFVKGLPAKTVGINWDPHNDLGHKQTPFPDGYAVLPKQRVWNVQIKGKSLLEPGQVLDWAGIFNSLARDGYRGQVGLETHYFDGTLIEKSHRSMAEILRIAEPS